VSQYQQGKTDLDFTEARDSEWQWNQLGHMQLCTSLGQINTPAPHHSVFLQAGCPSCCPTNSIKAMKASGTLKYHYILLYLQMYEGDRGSPRSLLGTVKTAVPSPLVYDVVEDGTVYDMGACSYIDDPTRQRLTVCSWLLLVPNKF